MKAWLILLMLMTGAAWAETDPLSVLPNVRPVDVVHLRQVVVAGGDLSAKLTPDQRDILQRYGNLPDGPQRYADSVLMTLPGLTSEQRSELAPLVAAVERDPKVQKRFWRMTYLILTPPQAQALTLRLPLGLKHGPNPNDWFGLPGLTEAQAGRIKARFLEFEAVAEPRMREAKGADPVHALAIQEDLMSRYEDIVADLSKTLTPAQRAARLELPPMTESEDLTHTMGDFMDVVQLTPAQAQQVQGWVAPIQAVQAEAEKRPKVPMEMMAARDEMTGAQLKAARSLVAIMTDDQRLAWIQK